MIGNSFEQKALELFRYQATHNSVYARYLDLLGIEPGTVQSAARIPHLPVRFFKSHRVYSASTPEECVFTSSSTTGMIPSHHYVASLETYRLNLLSIFRHFYGDPREYTVLALLPSYLERSGSSLVYMADALMKESARPENGFFLYDYPALFERLQSDASRGNKTWLIGVSFALLDFVKHFTVPTPGLIVVETGGMKGRGIELSREELHMRLKAGFPLSRIDSEYGMTELLSQAYSVKEDYFFDCPPTMQINIRNLQDPFTYEPDGVQGGINVTDLANTPSCAFIETEDLGIRHSDGRFRVLGRIPNAERRGCNMLTDIF